MNQQEGFSFDSGAGFDTGHGQGGFDFNPEGAQHSRDERERRRRHEQEETDRRKRERQQRQREESEERARQERTRSQHSHHWDSAWDVLGISPDATSKQIRAAWASKLKGCHPDLGGSVTDAQRFNAAYESLKKAGRR